MRRDLGGDNHPEMIVVIPAFNESMIFETLHALHASSNSARVMVIIVVNYSEVARDSVKQFNEVLYNVLQEWQDIYSIPQLYFRTLLAPNRRRKHAGAGLARKIGMDTAVDVFFRNNTIDGIIISLDADCLVKENYLNTIYHHFKNERDTDVSVIDFQHRSDLWDTRVQEAIKKYELYLNYYVLGCRAAGFPFAYHTVGSAFALRSGAYVKFGGMNKKHAGEDFYFLHKLFTNGKTSRIYETTVFPSARLSARVPFGTGPALKNILEKDDELSVYHPDAFRDLQQFYQHIPDMYEHDNAFENVQVSALKSFFEIINFSGIIREGRSNSASKRQFEKRILTRFDAFQLVKYLNYAHNYGYYKKIPVIAASTELLGIDIKGKNIDLVLKKARELERINHPRQLR